MASMLHGFLFILVLRIGVKGDISTDEIIKNGCYKQLCWKDETYPFEAINKEKTTIGLLREFSAKRSSSEPTISSTATCSLCNISLNLRVEALSIKEDDISFYVLRNKHYKETMIELNICEPDQQSSKCSKKEKRMDQEYQCKQKSTNMNLLVYDPLNHKFIGKNVTYPSACECTLMK